MRIATLAFCLAAATAGTPVAAKLPDAARAMIDAAIATGDAKKIDTVLDLAATTFPDEGEEIAAIRKDWNARAKERAAAAKTAEREAILTAGALVLWSGEGELGGFQSSGNSDTIGVSASLKLQREGIDWSHRLRVRLDYQRQNGTTSREQVLAAYEPRWQFDPAVFAYGLAQYERNRLQGVDARYSVSGGLGYRVIDRDDLSLSVKAGPAYRVTDYTDERMEKSLAGLVALDFDWQIFDRLTLTQDTNALAETGGEATVFFDGSNTTLNLITGLDFKVSDNLRARMSYQVDYDSDPPVGKVSTDTLTRATLIYGF